MEKDATPLIKTLAEQLTPLFNDENEPVIIGIETGGYWVANTLHKILEPSTQLGKLNISFYRDDFSKAGLHPTVKPSEINESLDGKTVILIDDVLQTGRTIRAAMNEIFDYGRPDKIILAVLIQRDGRELPIQTDYFALNIALKENEHVKLQGPEPITYRISNIEVT
ncbi:MAG: bifunctional pyr operon transcriptional regulator/uracil phosphoribosyltransferase PyrR [Gammaproteobacteria bacterium]|nr:bifunctional pyr operon transcriptional regulator/uracil phosphoribosyltransferase PyrR [Gammaproteobacteria bacterium]